LDSPMSHINADSLLSLGRASEPMPSRSDTASTNIAPGTLAAEFSPASHQVAKALTKPQTTRTKVPVPLITCQASDQRTGSTPMSMSDHPMAASTRIAYGYQPTPIYHELEVASHLNSQGSDPHSEQQLPSLKHTSLLSVGLKAALPCEKSDGDSVSCEGQAEHAASLAHTGPIESRQRAR